MACQGYDERNKSPQKRPRHLTTPSMLPARKLTVYVPIIMLREHRRANVCEFLTGLLVTPGCIRLEIFLPLLGKATVSVLLQRQ